jgi:hypothetical protein
VGHPSRDTNDHGQIMKLIIIESPFSSGTKPSIPAVVLRNTKYVRACMRDAFLKGEAPFASHAFYTLPGVLDDNIPEERVMGMEAGWAWMRVLEVNHVAVYTDLGISFGMSEGIRRAREVGRQVEERALGGVWASCVDASLCLSPTPGPNHVAECPFWRNI